MKDCVGVSSGQAHLPVPPGDPCPLYFGGCEAALEWASGRNRSFQGWPGALPHGTFP